MILVSFSSSVKYILSLMLAVLGYLPVEEVLNNEKINTPAPQQNIEYIIVLDSLNSNDSILINDYFVRTTSIEEINNPFTLQKEFIRLTDHDSTFLLIDHSELFTARHTFQID